MAKPKLLLVDDDINSLEGLAKIFTRYGYPVSSVFTGDDALKILSRENFDIIITDIKLPKMGGLTLIREIRKMGLSVSIIALTAYGTLVEDNAIKSGADNCLKKPVNIKELEEVLESLWKSKA